MKQRDYDVAVRSFFDMHDFATLGLLAKLEADHYPLSNFSMTIDFLDGLRTADVANWVDYWVQSRDFSAQMYSLKSDMSAVELGHMVLNIDKLVAYLRFGLTSDLQNRCLQELACALMLVSVASYHRDEVRGVAMRARGLLVELNHVFGKSDFPSDWTLVDPVPEVTVKLRALDRFQPAGGPAYSDEPWIQHGRKVLLRSDGSPVDSLADSSLWHFARRMSVSATDARKLIKLNGGRSKQFEGLLAAKISGERGAHYASYDLGIEREPIVASWVQANFAEYGFTHNRHLYLGDDERHTATPDMVAAKYLCEIKVSNKPLPEIRVRYRDQLLWQMHVTDALAVLFVVEDRDTEDIDFEWVERDQDRIDALRVAADELLRLLDDQLGDEAKHSHFQEKDDSAKPKMSPDEPEQEIDESPEGSIEYEGEVVLQVEEVVNLFRQGYDVYSIASQLKVEAIQVGIVLALKVLNQSEPLVDENAPNYGKYWETEHLNILEERFDEGMAIPEIAKLLGRDKLGVCFRILGSYATE